MSDPVGSGRWRYLDDGKIEVEGVGIPTAAWPKKVNDWKPQIAKYAARYGLPEHMVAGIMALESGGDATICSPRYACGAMQLTAPTAAARARKIGMSVPLFGIDRKDPETNIEIGVAELRAQIDRFHDYVIAAVGYNAGGLLHPPCKHTCQPCGKHPSVCPPCKTDADCAAGMTCKELSYWGVCTDGTAYQMLAIKYANTALDNGFALPGPLPDLANLPAVVLPKRPIVDTISPIAAILLTAGAAYGGYWLTHRSLRPRRRRARR